jgi:lysophospholipase L1-like esterase
MAFTSLPIATADSALTGTQGVAAIQKAHDMPSAADVQNNIESEILGNIHEKAITFIGDSTTAGSSGISRIYGYMMGSGNVVKGLLNYNQGVGGDTVQDVLDRMATIGADIGQVVDIQIGINDVTLETETAATYPIKVKELIARCFDYGAEKVILHTITIPDYAALSPQYTAAQIQLLEDFNAAIRALDLLNVVTESTAGENTTSADFEDGKHYSLSGALRIGKLQASPIERLSEVGYFKGLISDNLVTNPLMSGTAGSKAGGGSPTGDVADGWTIASPVLTGVVFSKTLNAISDGYEAQTVTVPSQELGSVSLIQLRQDVAITSTVVSDVYLLLCRFKLEAGHAGIDNIESKATGAFETEAELRTPPAMTTGEEYSGNLATVVKQAVAAGLTSIQVQINVRFKVGACACVIHWDKPVFRKIN